MNANRTAFPISTMARVLGVSAVGYHAWLRRPPSAHAEDAWSRRIVSWVAANHLRAQLVLDPLEMAVGQRRPQDVIRRSDQGSQYASIAFGRRCEEAGVRPSMGFMGDAYDSAMCESFFATLECELLDRRRFTSQAEAPVACFSYIEDFYNPVGLYSVLGYRSPIRYEQAVQTERQPAKP